MPVFKIELRAIYLDETPKGFYVMIRWGPHTVECIGYMPKRFIDTHLEIDRDEEH